MLVSKKAVIFSFFSLIILSFVFAPGFSRLQEIREQNKILLQEIERLKKENECFEQKEKMYQEDFYIEKLSRETLKMGKKGEVIYKIEEKF